MSIGHPGSEKAGGTVHDRGPWFRETSPFLLSVDDNSFKGLL